MIEPLRVPDLSDEENATLSLLVEKLSRKTVRNVLRSSYYDGRRVVREVGTTIPAQYERLAIVLGWAAKGVDGLARRCNIDQFVWTDGDIDSLGMRDLQDSNFLLSELSQARTDSLIHGVSYLITTQGVEGEPDALLHVRDALSTAGEWDARRRALSSLLSVTGRDPETGHVSEFNLYLDGVTVEARRDRGRWVSNRVEHPWGVPADPLIYRPRTSKPMGRSRITRPAMAIQDAALRAMVRMEAHMDIYAISKMILLGADESIFKNPDGTQKASWQVVMGRVFGIPDDDDAANPRADVKEFKAESPEPHLAQLNALAKMMARETDLPDSDFALTDMANPTSADAYNASRENLIAEAEGTTADWSVPIRRAVTRALAMQNGLDAVPDAWSSIEPEWRSPIYLSKAAQADAGAKQLSMVPWLAETEVGLKLLGLGEQDRRIAMAEKRRMAGRALVESLLPRREVVAGDDGE